MIHGPRHGRAKGGASATSSTTTGMPHLRQHSSSYSRTPYSVTTRSFPRIWSTDAPAGWLSACAQPHSARTGRGTLKYPIWRGTLAISSDGTLTTTVSRGTAAGRRLANYSVHCIGEIDNQEAGGLTPPSPAARTASASTQPAGGTGAGFKARLKTCTRAAPERAHPRAHSLTRGAGMRMREDMLMPDILLCPEVANRCARV